MKKFFITVAVFLVGFTACKRGTADPNAIGIEQAAPSSNAPTDVTFAADDTTGVKADSVATTAIPEATAKEQSVPPKKTVPPAAGKAKKKVAAKRPAELAPAHYSNPKTWSTAQVKWSGIVAERSHLAVGDATNRMTTDNDKARGIYALYAVGRYLTLGNETMAEEYWIKFQAERNGPHSALLNDLFEVSKSVDDTFAKFVAAQTVPRKKKK